MSGVQQLVDCTSGVPLGALGQLAGQSGACQLNALRQGAGGFWKAQGDAPTTLNSARQLGVLYQSSFGTIQSPATSVTVSTANPNISILGTSLVVKGAAGTSGSAGGNITPGGIGGAGGAAIYCTSPTTAFIRVGTGCYVIGGGGGGGGGGAAASSSTPGGAGGAGGAGINSSGPLVIYLNGFVFGGSSGGAGGTGTGKGASPSNLGGGGGGGGWPNGNGGSSPSTGNPGSNGPGSIITTPPGGSGGAGGAAATNPMIRGNAGGAGQGFLPGTTLAVQSPTSALWVITGGAHN